MRRTFASIGAGLVWIAIMGGGFYLLYVSDLHEGLVGWAALMVLFGVAYWLARATHHGIKTMEFDV
jgi:hypothetical protein